MKAIKVFSLRWQQHYLESRMKIQFDKNLSLKLDRNLFALEEININPKQEKKWFSGWRD